MANATPSRIGQINEAGDALALFLKTFGGEVLVSFEDENVTQGRVMERNIQHGKSAQFPATGKIGSEYHTPGAELTGLSSPHAEVVIDVDGLLVSHSFLADIDEAMNHYEVRSVYSTEMGREMARQYDTTNLRCAILAARSAAIVSDGNGGSALTNASYDTDGSLLKDAVWASAQAFDEKNVSQERYVTFRPAQYYLLAAQTDLLNRDYGVKGGDYAKAMLPEVAGIKLLKCNHVPNANDSANTDIMAKYRADYSPTVGVAWTPSAVGVVRLKTLSAEADYDIRRQGTLMVAKYAVGHGALRPDCAVEIRTAAPV